MHCQQNNANYNNLSKEARTTLQDSLLKEQGYLCAYCMRRITKENMKIEHFISQDFIKNNSDVTITDLDYNNLLACCQGNEGKTPKEQHCDTKKANHNLSKNPANLNHNVQGSITYKNSGKIGSNDEVFNDEINKILNLNLAYLENNRKAILLIVQNELKKYDGSVPVAKLREYLTSWKQKDKNNKLPEYAGVAISYLTKRLRAS